MDPSTPTPLRHMTARLLVAIAEGRTTNSSLIDDQYPLTAEGAHPDIIRAAAMFAARQATRYGIELDELAKDWDETVDGQAAN